MTTNQTIDGVSRSDLELFLVYGTLTEESRAAGDRLRALLDAPKCKQCKGTGKLEHHLCPCGIGWGKPVSQPQGEPVACAHGIRAPHACDQCEAQNVVPDYWEDPDTGTCIDQWTKIQGLHGTEAYTVPLYRNAEQPAPVTTGYVQPVPDQCDRITWRGSYYHLPIEQPAPVAVTFQQVLTAYEYAESHPHKYLRGTTNWCAAVAYKLNACLGELKRLNTK